MGGHGATSGQSKGDNLPGLNGNPWPPDADSAHLQYAGGGASGIAGQFNGEVDNDTAADMYDAVRSFSGSGYYDIRRAQEENDTTSYMWDRAVLCEQFIEAGVASGNGWKGGPTYRGIDFISDEAYQVYANLKPGQIVDPNFGGTASWSSNKGVSFEEFSGGNNSVVFVHAGATQPKGVSIDRISANRGEMEVLVSKDAKFKVQRVEKYTGDGKVGDWNADYLLVYVEDA